MLNEDPSLWNQVPFKNIDNEDFIFKVNRESYLVKAGETRNFPKFMVRIALKHLVDKILIKQNPEGKFLSIQSKRDELAMKIIGEEVPFEKPIIPTEAEIVDRMNKESDLDRVLKKNKDNLKKKEDNVEIVTPPQTPITPEVPKAPKVEETVITNNSEEEKKDEAETTKETFDQIENEKNKALPSREQMLNYAKNTLMMDIDEPKTKKAFDKMSDEKLFVELGLNNEPDFN